MARVTWLQSENVCYPNGGMVRKGRAIVTENKHNPIELPYGEVRAVRAGIPDTFFTIPARLRYGGKTIKGYLTHHGEGYEFVPNADPFACQNCDEGRGCKATG